MKTGTDAAWSYDAAIRPEEAGQLLQRKGWDGKKPLLGMERLDEKACRALSQELGGTEALFLSGDCGAPVMTGILRRLSALVTSRYHAAVLSMERACPIVAVSMDERLDSLMKELRLCDPYLLHVGDEDLGRRLAGALSLAVQDKDSIGQHIQEETLRYRKELYNMGMFLKRYLEDALQKQ